MYQCEKKISVAVSQSPKCWDEPAIEVVWHFRIIELATLVIAASMA